MTSVAKRKANRANARASTGPTSAAGRARSARNAHRHGLTVPIHTDRDLADQAQALARLFAGRTTSPEVWRLATKAAFAQIEIDRIRQAARDVTRRGATRTLEPGDISVAEPGKALGGSEPIHDPPHSTASQVTVDEGFLHQLRTFADYEHRAVSRRNRALQDIDCQRLIESVAAKTSSPRAVNQPPCLPALTSGETASLAGMRCYTIRSTI